ncbi:MAG: metal-dependent hydrolase [Euryarchaeota archaeon]|nr:metal-dependent hydrolase [Euryarchaeota archaeon]
MMWITHVVFGLFLYIIAVHLGFLPYETSYFVIVGIASLIPDIDHPGSKISKLLRLKKISEKLTHRGFLHSAYPALLLFLGAYLLACYSGFSEKAITVGMLLVIGYVSHLVLDSLNPTGVKWIYPRAKVRGPIKTGSYGELAILFVISYALSILFFSSVLRMLINKDTLLMALGISIIISAAMEGEVIFRRS